MKKVIISGIHGQDGCYLSEYLLGLKDYIVLGGTRRTVARGNLKSQLANKNFRLVPLDLGDVHSITSLIKNEKPDYFINLGASTFVPDSWNNPSTCLQVNSVALIHILEAVRSYSPRCRVYSAGSSEQFGNVEYSPQDIKHPNNPRSIYAVSKSAAEMICKVYRESYGIHVVHGILFNHESKIRPEYFVTRKISKGVASIKKALDKNLPFSPIVLGNIDAKRDWGHSADFVNGIWKMINQETPKNYILSSGETHSIREFIELAFNFVGIHLIETQDSAKEPNGWRPLINVYKKSDSGDILVQSHKEFYRPAEVQLLCGDSSPAKTELGWKPKYSFKELVEEMVLSDLENEKN